MSLADKLSNAFSALLRGKITEDEYKAKVEELKAQRAAKNADKKK